MNKVRPCLWFDTQAEEAAQFYTSVFKDAKLGAVARYPQVGQEIHAKPAGSVLTVEFELFGQTFIALNGGSDFKFNESVSFEVRCADQAEIDYYWERLGAAGDPSAQQCGWLKDGFGLSWQIVPEELDRWLNHPDRAKSERAFAAMLQMKKLDAAAIKRAFEGEPVAPGRNN
jgi:predicted 3-demethylubiquinone-9 3-methyltransferase (glyoxalase superfamily)